MPARGRKRSAAAVHTTHRPDPAGSHHSAHRQSGLLAEWQLQLLEEVAAVQHTRALAILPTMRLRLQDQREDAQVLQQLRRVPRRRRAVFAVRAPQAQVKELAQAGQHILCDIILPLIYLYIQYHLWVYTCTCVSKLCITKISLLLIFLGFLFIKKMTAHLRGF